MCTRVTEVFSLQKDPMAHPLGQTPGREKRCGTPSKAVQEFLKLFLELLIRSRLQIGLLQLFQRGHECLGDEYSPIAAKVAS